MATVERETARELEERFGGVYELNALARFCGLSSRALRQALERAGVPVLAFGRKQAVLRELADSALGLDRAEVALEIKRNEAAMRRLELRPDGRRKTVAEVAAESSARARAALEAVDAARAR
jgi:hypothetical protein